MENNENKVNMDHLSDKELSKVVMMMEDMYPALNRLPDYKLVGFKTTENSGKSEHPIWIKTWYDRSKYNGAKLRALRKERGVGRPPQKSIDKSPESEYSYSTSCDVV